jgi:hypothetical protein
MGDEELEELFGHESRGGAGDLIDVDGAKDKGGEQDENADDQVSCHCTSDVWLDFKKLFKKGPKCKMELYISNAEEFASSQRSFHYFHTSQLS